MRRTNATFMQKVREIIAYKHYFEDFFRVQSALVQDKIYKILHTIETLERVPSQYLKHIIGTNGLYEARIQLGTILEGVLFFRRRTTSYPIEWLSKENAKNPQAGN